MKQMAIPQHGPQNKLTKLYNHGHKISKRFTQADYSNTKAHTHSIKLAIYSDICQLLSFSSTSLVQITVVSLANLHMRPETLSRCYVTSYWQAEWLKKLRWKTIELPSPWPCSFLNFPRNKKLVIFRSLDQIARKGIKPCTSFEKILIYIYLKKVLPINHIFLTKTHLTKTANQPLDIIQQLMNSAFVGYEELSRSRRVLSTEALLFIQNNSQFKDIAKTCLPASMLNLSSIVYVQVCPAPQLFSKQQMSPSELSSC